jgi:hypothetical protein
MRGHPFMGQFWNVYGVSPTKGSGGWLYSPEEMPRHRSGLFSPPSDQTTFESRAKMRFSRSVGEPSGTYPKRSDGGDRGRTVGPIIWPVSPRGPHMGSSLMGACVSSCRFQNVLIHVKRSPDEGVMPVLPNRALRLISTDSGLRIWQLIYLFRSSRWALCNVAL